MKSTILVTACFLVLPGCLVDESTDQVVEAFGLDNLAFDGDVAVVALPIIEGRFETEGDNTTWEVSHVFNVTSSLSISKGDIGPQGGGGVSQDLVMPAARLQLRLTVAERLSGLTALWTLLDEGGNDTVTAQAPADAVASFELTKPGIHDARVELLEGTRIVARSAIPFLGTVNARWLVATEIHPLRFLPVEPPNYDEMRDTYTFRLDDFAPAFAADTAFIGTWPGEDGTDVDLELFNGGGRVACSRHLIDENQPQGPVQSTERISGGIGPETWTITVGALTQDCNGQMPRYLNAQPVPYTLEVRLRWA